MSWLVIVVIGYYVPIQRRYTLKNKPYASLSLMWVFASCKKIILLMKIICIKTR